MNNILLFAAGSLKGAFGPLLTAFQAQSDCRVETVFGPAGLLRQRIEKGESPHIFASANLAHPQRLVDLRLAQRVESFAGNRLCATVRNVAGLTEPPLLEVLLDSRWRVATSTPGADPSGDYAQQLFDRLEGAMPGQGEALRSRALALVGGADSAPVPQDRLAAEYLINNGQADIFLGYASYGTALARYPELAVRQLPPPLVIEADYGLCLLAPQAQPLAEFILADQGQAILREQGFLSSKQDTSGTYALTDQRWQPLAEKLVGVDLTKEDPFRLLQQYVVEQGDNIANYGLALAVTPEGEMILLANRLKLTDLNLGSAGEIQDYQCAVAGNGL